MSSLAQEESRSISENVTWGQRKRFADGKVSLPYSSFLGYTKGKNGIPEIVPKEAEIVKRIYKMFIGGKTLNAIAVTLTSEGIPTPRGKEKWQTSTIESILTNEKYKGAAILQKKFTVDFLQKKMKVNEGEVPQYIVENSHPAIINPNEWELVQKEMLVRKSRGKHHNSLSPFYAKIRCGDCGEYYGSKVWHSNDKYRRVIWQCNSKFKNGSTCHTPHLYEDDIKTLFIKAVSELTADRSVLLDTCRTVIDQFADTDKIDSESKELLDEMDVVSGLIKKLIDENAGTSMNQSDYNKRYDGYAERYNKLKDKYDSLQRLKITRTFQADIIECFMFEINALPDLPIDYSDRLWLSLIDCVTVTNDESIEFTFKNGAKITEML